MNGQRADVVVYDALVLTVDSENRLLDGGTVVVRDGRITEVRPTRDGDERLDADHSIDGDGKLVLPGLVNTHTHLELTPLLGAFSDWELRELVLQMTVLFDQLDDASLAYLREAGYELAALNFLLGGVTTVNAMDIRPGQGATVFGEAGLRGFFGPAITDLFWDVPVDAQFDRARAFVEAHHDTYDGRIRATICPHDDWSCSREFWERTADLAADYPELLVHTHLLELAESDAMGRANGADDSLDLLESVGLLDDRLVAAHCRVADDDDIRRFAVADAAVAHCPSVMAYWNPGPEMQWTPVPEMRAAGVDVGLGIDDHYWHDSYSMFGEARQARMAANLKRTAGQYESMELLRMLTIEGARALGVGDEIGSVEAGKRADMVVLDVDRPKFTPLTNVPAQVVNGATPADVTSVFVDGVPLLRDGAVETMDPAAVRERAEAAVERFQDETDWELSLAGGEPPGHAATLRDIPKRGPVRLLGRLAMQHLKDAVPR